MLKELSHQFLFPKVFADLLNKECPDIISGGQGLPRVSRGVHFEFQRSLLSIWTALGDKFGTPSVYHIFFFSEL